jgi:hypothetical protein
MGIAVANMLRKSLVGFAALALVAAACSDDDDKQSDPETALNTYANGINAASVDDAMAAFAEDSRMIGRPLHPRELNGKEEIRLGVSETVNFARADPDPYIISDVVTEDDTVSWSYVWFNNDGEQFCSNGNEIDANTDGLIVDLRWGQNEDCDE